MQSKTLRGKMENHTDTPAFFTYMYVRRHAYCWYIVKWNQLAQNVWAKVISLRGVPQCRLIIDLHDSLIY